MADADRRAEFLEAMRELVARYGSRVPLLVPGPAWGPELGADQSYGLPACSNPTSHCR